MSEHTENLSVPLDDDNGIEDFDAFWASVDRGGKTTTIMGERVTLPASIPLQFELEARKLQRSKNERDMRKLVGILFGEGALEKWSKRGLDLHQLMVLLAWAPQVIAGKRVSLAEVDAEIRVAMAEGVAADPT